MCRISQAAVGMAVIAWSRLAHASPPFFGCDWFNNGIDGSWPTFVAEAGETATVCEGPALDPPVTVPAPTNSTPEDAGTRRWSFYWDMSELNNAAYGLRLINVRYSTDPTSLASSVDCEAAPDSTCVLARLDLAYIYTRYSASVAYDDTSCTDDGNADDPESEIHCRAAPRTVCNFRSSPDRDHARRG